MNAVSGDLLAKAERFDQADFGAVLAIAPLQAGGPADDLRRLVADARDRWLVLAPAEALALSGFRRAMQEAIHARPDVDVFYADDMALGETDPAHRLRLKPSFNLALLAAQDYVGAPVVVRGSAFHRLGGLRPEMGEAAVYDLVLRAYAHGLGIERIARVLLAFPGARPETPVEARRRALEAWVGAGPLQAAPGRTPGSLQLARRFDAFPDVTLVIPTRQGGPAARPFVVELLDSLAGTDWPMDRLKVLVGDDSDRAGTFPAGRWPFAVERLATPRPGGEPFNYAAKMNRLWRAAGTEHMVFVNDDVTVRASGWLKALMTFAMDRDVGGVGARLVFPDGRVQHAGVAGGLFGAAAHPWFGQPPEAPTYQDWALVHRDWSMVTGAVFATRRSVMESLGGFDERFTLEFNDLDLCLRMRLLGLRIVYTPFAELAHREKGSRGETLPAGEEIALFLNRWRAWLADDPAYHPGLSRDRFAPEPVEAAPLA